MARPNHDRSGHECAVRYVTQDDREQAEATGQLIESQCTPKSPGLVSGAMLEGHKSEPVCAIV